MTDLKDFLHSVKGSKDSNLYDHLSNIFTKILLENPKNAYDFFEDYSFDIKTNGYDYKKSQDNLMQKREKYEDLKDFIARSNKLFTVYRLLFLFNYKENCISIRKSTLEQKKILKNLAPVDMFPISLKSLNCSNGQESISARILPIKYSNH